MSSGWGYYDTELARTRARDLCAELGERLLDAIAAVRAREGEAAASAGLLDRRPQADATLVEFEAWNQQAAAESHRLERRAASYDERQGSEGLANRFRQLAASGRIARKREVSSKDEGRGTSVALGSPAARKSLATGSAAPGGPPVDAESESTSPAEKIRRIAGALDAVDPEADATERAELTALASTILAADDDVFATLLTDLKMRAQTVNRAAAARREQAAQAEALLVSLVGLEGSEAADARSLLERVKRGASSLRASDVASIEQVRERALAERERGFVAARLAQALGGLGYAVGAEFETELRAGRPGVALVEASPEHAVQVEVGDGELAYRLVRSVPGNDPDRDRTLESELCKSMGRALGDLHGAGVGFVFTEHHEPGERAVEVSNGAAQERRRHDRTVRSEPKARERER